VEFQQGDFCTHPAQGFGCEIHALDGNVMIDIAAAQEDRHACQ
jgi:hypothetical protein